MRCATVGARKAFGSTAVLRGVDLTVGDRGFSVLVGPSGCGKSTLLRAIAGLESLDEGSIWIDEQDVSEWAPRDRDVAMVFQNYALYPHLTVRDNLAFGLRLRKTGESEIDARTREVSEMLGLGPLLGRYPKQLSGGQRQRVAMGRALVRRAKLYLFDEPLSNLDAALRADVRVEVRKLHERLGTTSVYVTHDQVEAMTLADTLWVLHGGHVVQSGPPMEVYDHPATTFVATFLGSPPMNLFECTLHAQDGGFRAEGTTFRSPLLEAGHLDVRCEPGQRVLCGVRPHALGIAVSSNGASDAPNLRAKVEVVEWLGFEAYAYARSESGERVIAWLAPNDARRVRATDVLDLRVDAREVHLFDAASGVSLGRRVHPSHHCVPEGRALGGAPNGPSGSLASGPPDRSRAS